MYNYLFIGNILDFCINHIFGNSFYIVLKSFLVIETCYLVNFKILSLILLVANYYDLKFGIIPNKLSLILFIYALIFNLALSIILGDGLVFIFSILLSSFVALISFLLWYLGFWGGGDLKLFIGLSLSLSFLDIKYIGILNSFGLSLFDLNNLVIKSGINNLNLAIYNQFVFYPKVFAILLNGIIIAFISLLLIILFNIIRNKQLRYYSIMSILDFKSMLNHLSSKLIHIDNLSEGMILDKYYLNDENVYTMIKNREKNYDGVLNTNLNVYSCEDIFYISSLNRIGLTNEDVDFIKNLYENKLILNPYFQIKRGIPFIPFLTLGYFSFLFFGDFISIISSFILAMF